MGKLDEDVSITSVTAEEGNGGPGENRNGSEGGLLFSTRDC